MTHSATAPDTPLPSPLSQHPERHYLLFSLSALFLLVVCLADRGLEWWCLVPALIGCLALLTHWSYGPPLVLLCLAGLLGMAGPRSRGVYAGRVLFQAPTLMDLVLCVAVLAYVLGHYRLLSLVRNIFPLDPRKLRDDSSQRRSVDLVTSREMALLGLTLPLWTGLSVMVWVMQMMQTMDFLPPRARTLATAQSVDMPRELGLVWAGLTVLAVAGTLAGYLRWMTATPEESVLFLQDQCWRHTRREQSILNRWLTRARLRAQRKKESS